MDAPVTRLLRVFLLPAVLLTGALHATPACADQLMFLDLMQARAALAQLRSGEVVHHFCAPCGDPRSVRMTVRTLGIDRIWDDSGTARPYRSDGRTFWAVELNDEAIDLAYVYVRRGSQWRNLARLAGLAPHDVPDVLQPAQVGTRWRCGTAADPDDDNPYWTILEQRRDPCPLDDTYARGTESSGWR